MKSFSFRSTLALVTSLLALSSPWAAERILLANPSGTTLAAASASDRVLADKLARLRAMAQDKGSTRLIIGVRAAFAPEGELAASQALTQRLDIGNAQSTVLQRLSVITGGNKAVTRFETIPFLALAVSPAEFDTLTSDSNVLSIEEDALRKTTLAESSPLIGATTSSAAGYNGSGQAVAILDTGVDKTHPFLSGRVVSEACYSSNNTSYSSATVCPGGATDSTATGSGVNCGADCDHGTHVAGIVAGTGASFSGVARGANLIAVQVFSRFNSTYYCGGAASCVMSYTSDQIKGLERIYALRSTYSIASVNMSLGGGQYYDQASCDSANSAIKASIDNLRAVGIATVIASGNSAYTNSMGAPGCISSAISVGSTWDVAGQSANWSNCSEASSTVNKVACYSNSVSFLNLLAPGSAINSSIPGGGYAVYHGTSMATPQVAGAWAVLKQASPGLSVTNALNTLTSTGVSVTDYRNSLLKKRIDLVAALASLVPATTYALTVNSSGATSVAITATVPTYAGTTPYSKTNIAAGTIITLTAPATAGGATFSSWSGCDSPSSVTCAVTMNATKSVTASYSSVQSQTITFGTAPMVVVGGTGSVSASGGASGQPVIFTSTTPSFCTVSGTTVTGVAVGTCTVAANQAGNGSYSAAPQVIQNISISPATTYTLNVNSSGATSIAISASPTTYAGTTNYSKASIAAGTVITLTAPTTAGGATFSSWSGCDLPSGAACTVTMNAVKSVTANFVTQSLTLTSAAFLNGGVIPNQFTYNFSGQCSGNNWSPPFEINNIPNGTKSLAIVVTDPDGGDWLHWKAWNIPASTSSLPYNSSNSATYSQTINDFGTSGYGGPCPPSPNHHYNFKLYALNSTFSSSPTTVQLEGAAIATAVLQGVRSPTDNVSWTPPTAQTIVFGTAPTVVVGGTGSVSASGGASGQPVIFTSTTPSFCTVSGTTVSGVAVGSCAVAANQAGNGSYSAAAQVTQNINISPVSIYTLTVNASGATTSVAITATVTAYAGTTPYSKTSIAAGTVITLTAPATTASAKFSSWSGCDSTSLSVNCTVTMSAAKSVTASYSSLQSQTITFGTAPTVVVGGTGSVSASGGASGQPVIFTSTTPSFCTVSGSTVTGVAVGQCTIAANQPGNGSYSAAPEMRQSFNITIPPGATPPSPPTIIPPITAGRGSARLNLSPPSANGGTAIVAYAATCAASGQAAKTATSAGLSFAVRGLKGGVVYACTATASNAFYASAASTAQTVTPLAGGSSIAPILMLLLD